MGPAVVVTLMLERMAMGSVSVATPPRGLPTYRSVLEPDAPTMVIVVPARAFAGMMARAWRTVRKAQRATAAPMARPLPVPARSLPFTGSTKYWLPATASQVVQLLAMQA
jgi:hypothetical protein